MVMSMNKDEITMSVGVDFVDTRYVLCIVDREGLYPRYSSGRWDTEGGQLKFLSKVKRGAVVLIPDSNLAIRAFQLFGDCIHIASEGSLWGAWERAGVKRGKAMARFAALYVLQEELPPMQLTSKQIQQIHADHALELEQIQRIGEESQHITMNVLSGKADGKDYDRAIKNEYDSGIKPSSLPVQEEKDPLFDEKDESFLARLSRYLNKEE